MSTRPVLLLQANTSSIDLTGPLQAADWEVHRSFEIGHRDTSEGIQRCHVGLLVLDPPHAFTARDLERLTTLGPIEWIAVLPREALRQPALARAIVSSCYDFHTLPVDIERLKVVLGHAAGRLRMVRELAETPLDGEGRYGMVGRSPAMLDLYRDLEKVARADAPVLIQGESGTGKEMAARAIHQNSARRDGPFIAVNCGALPTHLIQSELFGHEKGSFTGAYQRKIGSIEAAEGGLVFLDEIGDLPLELQANLLRFLQEKTISRLGSTQPVAVDVRVVAATHVDLRAAVADGRFREDLFYRLNVLQLVVPPLRDRGMDLELLAKACFRQFAKATNHRVHGFSTSAIDSLLAHNWPGNVRELINRVQKAIIMSENRLVMPGDLDLEPPNPMNGHQPTLSRARAQTEEGLIKQSLTRNHGNVSKTARELGVSRVTLYRLIDKFGIGLR